MQLYDALTAAELAAANRVVPRGDIWFESDTGYGKRGDGAKAWADLPFWTGGRQSLYVEKIAAQASSDGVALADVVGMSFPVAANGVYAIEYNIFTISAATTSGLVLALNGPADPTFVHYAVRAPTSATATAHFAASAFDTELVAADNVSTTVPHLAELKGYLVNGSTAGTLALRFRTEVDTSAATISRGSWGRLTRLR